MTSFGHHVLRNRYRFEGDLELVTGLRLSTGRASDESDAPLMRTRAGELYIPGSSLRGAIRSELERMIPELGLGLRSCTLFLADESKDACLTASMAKQMYRDMIGIDRFTGGVHSGANMRFHALEGTTFETTVSVRNFELWQLGLLAYVFRDFAEGLVSIGFGKSKGFGQVKGEVKAVTLSYPSGRADGKVQHLGSLCPPEECAGYGLAPFDALSVPMTELPVPQPSLYKTYAVADLDLFWQAAAPAFNDFVEKRAAGQERSA